MPDRNPDDGYRLVTKEDLREALKTIPTRWEMRFMILSVFLAGQFIPTVDVARAAISVIS